MPATDTSAKVAPTNFMQTITIAEGAVRLGTAHVYGRKITLTGYPLNAATNIYIGYDATVSATNFAQAIRGGDMLIDESSGPHDRRTPFIFWIAVAADNTGVAVGVE